MYCSSCGSSNIDGATFCQECGAPLVQESAPAAVAAAHAAQTAPAVQKGCMGQAFSDITSSPNWLKRVLLLMVMECVPILDLFADGYIVQWGARAAKGDNAPLEPGGFNKQSFIMGLIRLLLAALTAIGTLVFVIFDFIPVVGSIIVCVAGLFASTFCYLSIIRVGVTGKLSSAFDLSELFAKYRKNLGSLFAAAAVPGIICGVIICVIAGIIFGIAIGANANLIGYIVWYGINDLESLMSILAALGVAVAIVILIAVFISAFGEIWAFRGVGLWVARNAQDWNEGTAAPALEVAGEDTEAETTDEVVAE